MVNLIGLSALWACGRSWYQQIWLKSAMSQKATSHLWRYQRCKMTVVLCLVLSSSGHLLCQAREPARKRPGCNITPCLYVHVDRVSLYDRDITLGRTVVVNKGSIDFITVSNSTDTYFLSCNPSKRSCVSPITNAEYELVTESSPKLEFIKSLKGFYEKDKPAYLISDGGTLGPYFVKAHISMAANDEFRQLIKECRLKDDRASDIDCGKWISKRRYALLAACPETAAQKSCNSFKELLRNNDADLMDDLATKDHVYGCFLPNVDTFFEVYFAEPDGTWEKPDPDQHESGLSSTAFYVFGGAGVIYYKDGVGVPDMSYHNTGKWKYEPPDSHADSYTVENAATSENAAFEASNIHIENTRFVFLDSYKNRTGTNTAHTITLQRATGRFTDAYEVTPSAKPIDITSGRCLVLPTPTE